ncbi:MAG TPA: ammonium transporter [Thermoleophilia bacterium]|nr:ammonium transporter [Thermoleophilia bacterium]
MSHINPGDTAFVLICAALVAVMTPGLAFFYGGLVRHKNVITIMMQSFVSLGVVTLIWVTVGFTLAFGHDVHGVIGGLDYLFLNGVGQAPNAQYAPTVPFLAFFVFQLTVAALTPALITGAFADRVPFGSYLIFLACWSLLVYVPIAHWIWGHGFLEQWGVLDFGGGMVVHGAAGFSALASIFVVRKRVFAPGEEERPSNIPLIAIGLGLLWFGWLGDNPAGAFAANGVAAQAFVNTFIAGGCAMVVWLFTDWVRTGKASMVGSLTGVLAGLVAVTPCAGFVPTWAAVFIALAAGWICYGALQFRKWRQWDDSLDVWGVHGIGGLFGSLMVGWFAFGAVNGASGLMDGNPRQFGLQLAAVAITLAYTFAVTWVIFKVIDVLGHLSVSAHVQVKGLDEELHGETAYAFD